MDMSFKESLECMKKRKYLQYFLEIFFKKFSIQQQNETKHFRAACNVLS